MRGRGGSRGNEEGEGGKGHGSPSERHLEFGGRKSTRGRMRESDREERERCFKVERNSKKKRGGMKEQGAAEKSFKVPERKLNLQIFCRH